MTIATDQFLFLKSADALITECQKVLCLSPVLNHDVLQLLADISRESEFLSPPYHFVTFKRGPNLLGCGVSLEPDGLILSDLPADLAALVIKSIQHERIEIRRLVGPPRLVSNIAARLTENWNYRVSETVRWQVGRLDNITSGLHRARGAIRQASPEDAAIIETWARDYSQEKPAFLDIPRFMRLKMKKGDLYLWDDQGPRSLATISGTTQRGVRISSVYTPAAFRGRGYASCIVKTLGTQLLNSGYDFVMLTWRTGSDEGKIYKRLGFVTAGERSAYMFEISK